MGSVKIRSILIGVLSLFLLASSPVADLSRSIRGSTILSSTSNSTSETISTPEKSSFTAVKTRIFDTPTEVAASSAPVSLSYDHISIAGRNIPLFNSAPRGNVFPDSGAKVGVYGNFFYGHNSGAVFGGLASLSVGSTFSVTRGGQTARYVIRVKEVLARTSLDQHDEASTLTLSQIYHAAYRGQHSISLMTCAGTSYGNGDASHRLVIMADRI